MRTCWENRAHIVVYVGGVRNSCVLLWRWSVLSSQEHLAKQAGAQVTSPAKKVMAGGAEDTLRRVNPVRKVRKARTHDRKSNRRLEPSEMSSSQDSSSEGTHSVEEDIAAGMLKLAIACSHVARMSYKDDAAAGTLAPSRIRMALGSSLGFRVHGIVQKQKRVLKKLSIDASCSKRLLEKC